MTKSSGIAALSSLALVAASALVLLQRTGEARPAERRDDAEQDRRAIARLENEWLNAPDAATLDRILASDFVHPVPTGDFLTKAQHIEWFARQRRQADLRLRFDRMDVRLYGDVGVVNGVVTANDGRGQEVSKTVFTDVFAYRGGRWQAINAQENRVESPPTRK